MPAIPEEFFLRADRFIPAYMTLGLTELRRRAAEAIELLRSCEVCPRDCRVNRLEDRYAVCKTGRDARVSSFCPHFGEEDCLRGWRGSGTIFFAWCNLRCVFCLGPDVQITTDQGMRRIEDLFLSAHREVTHGEGRIRFPEGIRVWTRGGHPAPVGKIFCHGYEGEVIVIRPRGHPILTVTPEHAVFAVNGGNPGVFKVPAGALTPDHYLVAARPELAKAEYAPSSGFIMKAPSTIWRLTTATTPIWRTALPSETARTSISASLARAGSSPQQTLLG